MKKRLGFVLAVLAVGSFAQGAEVAKNTDSKNTKDSQAQTGNSSTAAFNASDYTSFKLGDAASGKLNVLLQGWAVQNQNSTPKDESYRLRRAEFKLSGAIANAPKYFIMIDPAKLITAPGAKSVSADHMIQDFGLSYALAPGLEVTAGQFKIPTTAEGLDPSSDLPLPERSVVGRTIGDKREMGVKASYKASQWNATAMLSSGRNVQTPGTGMFHDLDTRVELTPVKGLGFGTFLVLGNDFDYAKKGRWGLNARYAIKKASLRVEYARAKTGRVQSNGITTEVGYSLTENLQPIARYETYAPTQAFTNPGQAETVGVNYYFRRYYSKVQLAGTVMQNMAAVNGSPAVVKGAKNEEVTFVVQTAL